MCVDEQERPADRCGKVCHIGEVLEELLAEYPIRLPEPELQVAEEPVAV